MGLIWGVIAIAVVIAVIAFLNRRPGRSPLPPSFSPSPNPDEFTDVSGPNDIHFAPPRGHAASKAPGESGESASITAANHSGDV